MLDIILNGISCLFNTKFCLRGIYDNGYDNDCHKPLLISIE